MIGLHEAAANPSSGAHEVVPKRFSLPAPPHPLAPGKSARFGKVHKSAYEMKTGLKQDEKRLVKKCYIWRKVGGFFVRVLYFKQRSEPHAGRLPAGDRAGGYNFTSLDVASMVHHFQQLSRDGTGEGGDGRGMGAIVTTWLCVHFQLSCFRLLSIDFSHFCLVSL